MLKALFVICMLLAIAVVALIGIISNTKKSNSKDIAETLATIKREDDFVITLDKDKARIDEYCSVVKDAILTFDRSKNKLVSIKTKKALLKETINIIPVISKYTELDYTYDTTRNTKAQDRELMANVIDAYNNFSKEDLFTFNELLPALLKLIMNK